MLNEEQEKALAITQRHPKSNKPTKGSPLLSNTKHVYSTDKPEHVQVLGDYMPETEKKVEEPIDNQVIEPENDSLLRRKTKQVCNTGEPDDAHVYWDNLIAQMKADGEIDDDQTIDSDNETATDLSKDIFKLNELLSLKVSEVPFLVGNILPEKAITFLAGDSDVGKSLFYLQLVTAIIEEEKEFLGLKLNTIFKKALIINSEDSPVAIAVRIKKQLSGRLLSKELSQRLTIVTNGHDVVKRISQILKKEPHDLVVIDAFADVFEDDMNSANAVRTFLNQFAELIQEYGCTVLFVHHIGKGKESLVANKGHMLGSVGTHGKARSVIMLSKLATNPNMKTLKIAKNNYVSEDVKNTEIYLEFDPTTLLHKVVVDKSLIEDMTTQQKQAENPHQRKRGKTDLLKQEAWKLKESGNTLEAIGKIVGRDKSTVSKWLKTYEPLYDVSKVV